MSRIIGSFLHCQTQTMLRPVSVQSVSVRLKTRVKNYGSEPGFDIKNEARKERWILKNSPNRQCGGGWREDMGSDRHANRDGPLYDLPDYRYPDGSLGVPRWDQCGDLL